jgi:hypothetical protein
VAIPIHYSPAHNDALAQRFPRSLNRKVSIIGMNVGMAKDRACDLGESVRQEDERLRRVAADRGFVGFMKARRLVARRMPVIGNNDGTLIRQLAHTLLEPKLPPSSYYILFIFIRVLRVFDCRIIRH